MLSLKQLEILGVTLMGACLLTAVFFAFFLLYPYRPMESLTVSPKETEACPGAEVPISVSYYLEPELFKTVNGVEVKSNWLAEDVPGREKGAVVLAAEAFLPGEILEEGLRNAESRVSRRAPEEPGVWELDTEIIVRGTSFYLPKLQTTRVRSTESLTIMSNEACEGLSGRKP